MVGVVVDLNEEVKALWEEVLRLNKIISELEGQLISLRRLYQGDGRDE